MYCRGTLMADAPWGGPPQNLQPWGLGPLGGYNNDKTKENIRGRKLMAAKLSVVPASTGTKPARTLGKHGATLWRAVMSEYEIADAGGIEMLTAACQQLDRAESLREQIDLDGDI